MTHGLLVGAGPYGADNRCLLDGLAAGAGRLKGIALVEADVSDRELAALADHGVVGIRFNLSTHGMSQFLDPGVDRLFARIKEMGWFLQVHCEKDELVEAAPILRRAGVRVMVDHFGRPDVARGLGHAGFQTLLELGRTGNAVVKLSGPFRSSVEGYPVPRRRSRSSPPSSRRSPSTAASGAPTGPSCAWTSGWTTARRWSASSAGCPTPPTAGPCCGTPPPGCSASGSAPAQASPRMNFAACT